MDFLDPKKQRRHTIQLLIGYVLVACAVLLATTILVYYASGFNVTRSGKVVQKGLVFVSSQPSGAQLFVDDKRVQNTNAKLNLDAGNYNLTIRREGYHDWRRAIQVDGGSVDHYVYPFLVPRELKTESVAQYEEAPALTTQSLDRRWLLVQRAGADASFDLFDLQKKPQDISTYTSLVLPDNLVTSATSGVRWEVVEWSTNNRHVLLKRHFTADAQAQYEYILVDRARVDGSHNVTRELGLGKVELTLRDKKPDTYYVYDAAAKTLQAARLNSGEEFTRIASDVLDYKTYGRDVVLYSTTERAQSGAVSIMIKENDATYFLRHIPVGSQYLLDLARYDGDWYVVAGTVDDDRVYVYRNPVQAIKDNDNREIGSSFVLRFDDPTHVSFSANAQFIAVQSDTGIRLYDLEHDRAHRYAWSLPLDAPQKHVRWMDGYHLSYVSGSQHIMQDYDSRNRHILQAALPEYEPVFDRDYRFIFSFVKAKNGTDIELTMTALRTENDL